MTIDYKAQWIEAELLLGEANIEQDRSWFAWDTFLRRNDCEGSHPKPVWARLIDDMMSPDKLWDDESWEVFLAGQDKEMRPVMVEARTLYQVAQLNYSAFNSETKWTWLHRQMKL